MAADQLLLMDKAHTRGFGLTVAPGLASIAMGCDLCDSYFIRNPDFDDGNYLGFAVLPVDFHVDFCAVLAET